MSSPSRRGNPAKPHKLKAKPCGKIVANNSTQLAKIELEKSSKGCRRLFRPAAFPLKRNKSPPLSSPTPRLCAKTGGGAHLLHFPSMTDAYLARMRDLRQPLLHLSPQPPAAQIRQAPLRLLLRCQSADVCVLGPAQRRDKHAIFCACLRTIFPLDAFAVRVEDFAMPGFRSGLPFLSV